MYFESRQHQTLPVANAAEAVRTIHSGKVVDSHCPVWKNKNGHRIAIAADGHINRPWFEVAVINLDTREQYESITFGWCKTEAEKLNYILQCENGSSSRRQNVDLPLDGQGQDILTNFECGCCGETFPDTIRAQARFDQDAGYGICPACEVRY